MGTTSCDRCWKNKERTMCWRYRRRIVSGCKGNCAVWVLLPPSCQRMPGPCFLQDREVRERGSMNGPGFGSRWSERKTRAARRVGCSSDAVSPILLSGPTIGSMLQLRVSFLNWWGSLGVDGASKKAMNKRKGRSGSISTKYEDIGLGIGT